jgi:hypothetical protein
MGAEIFQTTGTGETAEDAFSQAVYQAQLDHGHDGYTGTIAEKSSCREFLAPNGLTVDEVIEELVKSKYRPTDCLIEEFGEEEAYRLFGTFDDKWGPAVSVKIDDSTWMFCGWASC